jgi:hypothetical protein
MATTIGDVVQSAVELLFSFAEIAQYDPLSALLLGVGGIIMVATMGVMGWLTAGAALDLVTPDRTGPPRHPEAR